MAAPRHAGAQDPVLCEYVVTRQRIAGGTRCTPRAGLVHSRGVRVRSGGSTPS